MAKNKVLVDRMPGNTKEHVKKLQFACGHLSEVGNLHARQNDRLLTSVILPGIGAINGKFASAFVSGDSRNASAINVVKSMTVQGMVLFYYQLKAQAKVLEKDFKGTQKSILETIQRRAGSNGSRLVQAITDNNSSEIMAGLNKTVPVLMAGHGLLMEDVVACWVIFRRRDAKMLEVYLGYTKSSAENGVAMFNLTIQLVAMPEPGAYKYLFTKFALRGIGSAQFDAAIKLNCVNTDWSRMAVTVMNHRGTYTEEDISHSKLRIRKMMQFKTDTADMQKASEMIGIEQTVVRFDVKLEGDAVEQMERNRDYELVQEWSTQKYGTFFKEMGTWVNGDLAGECVVLEELLTCEEICNCIQRW